MASRMNKGTYCLLISLAKGRGIRIGKRDPHFFPKGFYCYIGSAMINLDKRVDRHLAIEKRFHWHIDWFLNYAKVYEVKVIRNLERLECSLSRDLSAFSELSVMPGFGSSDCNCETHLHYFISKPDSVIGSQVRKIQREIKKGKSKRRHDRLSVG